MIRTMHNLTVVVFKYLEITYDMDVDERIKYTHRIHRETEINKCKQVLELCKESAKGISGYQWNLGAKKYVTMEQLWD